MTDQRFQDFPQKTTPDGTDELVGVDGSSYIRVPVSSLDTGVTSVNNKEGPAVSLTTADISDSPNRKYTTGADITRLANTAGTNTGDDAGYRTIQKAGSAPVTREGTLEFAGSGVAVTAGSNKTTVTVTGGGSGPSSSAGYIDRVLEPGAPIFLCGVGQSLMTPYPAQLSAWVPSYPTIDSPTPLPAIANTANSAIKEYCSDGLGGGGPYPGESFADGTSTGYGNGNGAPKDFAWRTLDINKTQVVDYTGMSITGYTGAGATNELHAMAVKLHEWTGRDVYIFMNHYSGHGLRQNYWPFAMPDDLVQTIKDPAGIQPDVTVQKGGMGYNKFVTDFDDAVAKGKLENALFPDTPTFFFWCSGGSDGLGDTRIDPMQWLEYYLDLDRELERAGRIEPSTPRLFWDYSENQDPVFQWGCYRVAAEYLQRPTNILQRTYETWDGTHPLGDRQFHDGTIQAQRLINFADAKNLDGGSKLQRNTEDVVTYATLLPPTNSAPTTLAVGQLGTNVAETVLRMPYKLLTAPSGTPVERLTHCEQFLPSNTTISLTEVDINGVIQTTPRTVTKPDGTTYVVDDPNRQTYQITGPGEWPGNVPEDSAGTPNHIVFPTNPVQSFGTWPPSNFSKVKVEYRESFPSIGGNGYGSVGLLGTKEYPSTPSGGIRTHVDTLFKKRIVVKTATDVPIMELKFIDDFPGVVTPIFPPQENGDYERYITVSSLPQYDSTTGLLLPARQANAGRYRVEARFDVNGTLPTGAFGLIYPLVLAPQVGFRGLISCATTFTGRRISPTPEPDDIYQVQRASLINFSGTENDPFWDTTLTPPSGVVNETAGHSASNFNEINPQGVSWYTPAQTWDQNSYFAPGSSGLIGRLWAIAPPAIAEERWRWKIVMDFSFDEYLG